MSILKLIKYIRFLDKVMFIKHLFKKKKNTENKFGVYKFSLVFNKFFLSRFQI